MGKAERSEAWHQQKKEKRSAKRQATKRHKLESQEGSRAWFENPDTLARVRKAFDYAPNPETDRILRYDALACHDLRLHADDDHPPLHNREVDALAPFYGSDSSKDINTCIPADFRRDYYNNVDRMREELLTCRLMAMRHMDVKLIQCAWLSGFWPHQSFDHNRRFVSFWYRLFTKLKAEGMGSEYQQAYLNAVDEASAGETAFVYRLKFIDMWRDAEGDEFALTRLNSRQIQALGSSNVGTKQAVQIARKSAPGVRARDFQMTALHHAHVNEYRKRSGLAADAPLRPEEGARLALQEKYDRALDPMDEDEDSSDDGEEDHVGGVVRGFGSLALGRKDADAEGLVANMQGMCIEGKASKGSAVDMSWLLNKDQVEVLSSGSITVSDDNPRRHVRTQFRRFIWDDEVGDYWLGEKFKKFKDDPPSELDRGLMEEPHRFSV